VADQVPFADVREEASGFSLPELKWRELLFVGALRASGGPGVYERDPARPLPPFRLPGLFPAGARFRAEAEGGRVRLVRVSAPGEDNGRMGAKHAFAVVPARPRETAQARFPDGRVFEAPPGTPLADLVCAAARPGEALVIAALLNGRLKELHETLSADADVAPVSLAQADGARIYRRSLVFLLVTAAAEVFPQAEVFIEHAASNSAGYYCEVRGRRPFSREELSRIEARMREIVAEDAPIEKVQLSPEQAMALFRERGEEDKERLFAHRRRQQLPLYRLRGRLDYFQGFMAPSAGYLQRFALAAFPPGFLLYFPHQARPDALPPVEPYPRLFAVFAEAGSWLDRLGIRGVGALNDAIAAGRLPEISLVAEALHEARIAEIAADIAKHGGRVKLVLIAGPSSSGKTTLSKRLAVQLLARGRRPFPLSMDDYFLEREKTPAGPDGKPDFENLHALDLPLFNEQLLGLMEGREVALPQFNFKSGRRERGTVVRLPRDGVIIVEGIHGLNPALVAGLPGERLYRVYVSALTQLNLDRHNRVSTTDTRLVRRIVRDAARRGYTARDTLARWDAVTRAEKENIFPFQELADAFFNSSLVHELAVLRPLAEPLLLQVRPTSGEFVEANRLLSFLNWFEPASADPVPDNSILREFVGGSILEGFRLWPLGGR
jgi:uridine kinase